MFGGRLGFPELLVTVLVLTASLIILALFVFAWSKVFTKAGYPPLLCLLMLIPVVSLIAFLWFAFSTWPIHKDVPAALRPAPED